MHVIWGENIDEVKPQKEFKKNSNSLGNSAYSLYGLNCVLPKLIA